MQKPQRWVHFPRKSPHPSGSLLHAHLQTAVKILDGLGLASFDSLLEGRVHIIRRFCSAGMPHGYQYYLKLLNLKGPKLIQIKFSEPTANVFAREIVEDFAEDDPQIERIRSSTKNDPAKRIELLRTWLQNQIKRLRNEPVK